MFKKQDIQYNFFLTLSGISGIMSIIKQFTFYYWNMNIDN